MNNVATQQKLEGSEARTMNQLKTPRIAFFCMQKNEVELLPLWIDFHAQFTPYNDIFVLDNGSDNIENLNALKIYAQKGVNVIRKFRKRSDFENKGEIILQIMREVNASNGYDFLVPVDCDELLCLKRGNFIDTDPIAILKYFRELKDLGRGFRINNCFNNIAGELNLFKYTVHEKVFFSKSSELKRLDVGFHLKGVEDLVPTELGYIHLHNKAYVDVLRSAREKLKARVANFSIDELQNYRKQGGRGAHLVKYFLMNEGDYISRRPNPPYVNYKLSELANALGHELVIKKPGPELEDEIFWLKSPCNDAALNKSALDIFQIQNWANVLVIPFFDGLEGCPNGNMLYSSESGYGWINRAPKYVRRREIDNDLLANFVLSFDNLIYGVSLPKGRYRIALLVYDCLFDNHAVGIKVNGLEVEPIPNKKGEYSILECTVQHPGGVIKVGIYSNRNNIIANCLVIERTVKSLRAVARTDRMVSNLKFQGKWNKRHWATAIDVNQGGGKASFSLQPVSSGEYIDLVSKIVRAFLDLQDENGAIIDRYFERECQYATPAFALAAAYVATTTDDRELFAASSKALSWSAQCLASRSAADGHEDFFPFLVARTYGLLCNSLSAETKDRIKKDLTSFNPYNVYRSPVGGSDKAGQNWNMIASAGEYQLHRAGFIRDLGFVQNSLAQQGRHFDPSSGIYAEGPVVYDLKARVFWSVAITEGYSGPYASDVCNALTKGMRTSLYLQAPNGELLPGGRSGHHVWSDALQCVLFETAALWDFDEGQRKQFRGAARLAFDAIKCFSCEDSGIHTVRNRYSNEERVGFEPYTSESHYNLFAAAMLSIADQYGGKNVNVPAVTPPSLCSSFVADFRETLGRVVAGCEGSQIVIDCGKNGKQNPGGIIRVHVGGLDGFSFLPDGAVPSPSYYQKEGGSELAIAPGWRRSSADQQATFLKRTAGFSIVSSKVDCSAVHLKVEYSDESDRVFENISIEPKKISISYDFKHNLIETVLRLPFLFFDGQIETVVSRDDEGVFRLKDGLGRSVFLEFPYAKSAFVSTEIVPFRRGYLKYIDAIYAANEICSVNLYAG